MDLRQFTYVVAVADLGTFTAAARASHVAQPSLSQAVRSLERELGVVLFQRTGRSAVPTSAGSTVVAHAREALRAAAAVRSAAAAVQGVLAGELQIASLPTLAVEPLTALVGAFRRRFPAVTVHLAPADDLRSLVEALRDGRAELGLTELPVAGEDLVTVALGRQELVVVLPPGGFPGMGGPAVPTTRREPSGVGPSGVGSSGVGPSGVGSAAPGGPSRGSSGADEPLTLADLATLPLIATPEGASLRHLVDEALAAAGLEARVVVVAAAREAIVPLVLAGAGAAVLSRALATPAEALGATVRALTPALRRDIGLVHRRSSLSPAAEAFLAVVGEGREIAPAGEEAAGRLTASTPCTRQLETGTRPGSEGGRS
jgi:LysR family transcriptional regulator, carnitine catabolism transcriptional activator